MTLEGFSSMSVLWKDLDEIVEEIIDNPLLSAQMMRNGVVIDQEWLLEERRKRRADRQGETHDSDAI